MFVLIVLMQQCGVLAVAAVAKCLIVIILLFSFSSYRRHCYTIILFPP